MKIVFVLNLLAFASSAIGFGGSEDKFLKKYAMMKIYESCFGPEVVKQIRQEMKLACAKCASLETPALPQPTPPAPPHKDDSGNAFYEPPSPNQANFDVEKLHQAILAYRPNSAPSPFYRPFSGGLAPLYSPYANPTFQGPMLYPGFPQPNNQFSPYAAFPLLGQPFYGNRVSRDMDVKTQLEMLTSRMSGKVRNVTCVMQELGYLTDNLEPNYVRIIERIKHLPVGDELKNDMQDGVEFCQQFSQCVPEIKTDKSPLSRDLIRPMFFFKCYKHKKLEACIMKDVKEKYAGMTDEDEFENDGDFKRRGKSADLPKAEADIEQLASSMYEFLYGSESNIDIDGVL